jgi:hypothetical protein
MEIVALPSGGTVRSADVGVHSTPTSRASPAALGVSADEPRTTAPQPPPGAVVRWAPRLPDSAG